MSTEYHKINTVFNRNPATGHKRLLIGEYSRPEFEYLKNNPWMFTEKVDGTNTRVIFDGETVEFAGRTDAAQMPPKLGKALQALFPTEKIEAAFPEATERSQQGIRCEIVLYGEGYGASIQKGGGNYRPDVSFVLFDVRVGGMFLERHNVEDVAKKLAIDTAPIIGTGTLHDLVERCREGFPSNWGPFQAEGIIARPEIELEDRAGRRIITKLKHRDFLA